jgi:hypothetical protein
MTPTPGFGLTFYSARPALEHQRLQGKLASRGHQFIEPSALRHTKAIWFRVPSSQGTGFSMAARPACIGQ